MTEKPSRNEEEYFARREAELLRQSRERAAQEARMAERRSHYMKCPKCGADLTTVDYEGVQVDRCPECHGLWFDAGEAEALLKHDSGGVMNILKSVFRGVGR